MINTGKNSRKYPACQLLYWYRSNELWKTRFDEEFLALFRKHSLEFDAKFVFGWVSRPWRSRLLFATFPSPDGLG
jgi:hypothetical protein